MDQTCIAEIFDGLGRLQSLIAGDEPGHPYSASIWRELRAFATWLSETCEIEQRFRGIVQQGDAGQFAGAGGRMSLASAESGQESMADVIRRLMPGKAK